MYDAYFDFRERLLGDSAVRTLDPEEADVFYWRVALRHPVRRAGATPRRRRRCSIWQLNHCVTI